MLAILLGTALGFLLLADLVRFARAAAFMRWHHERFHYRLHSGGDQEQVSIGKRLKENSFVAENFVVLDDMDRKVHFPDGQSFQFETIEGLHCDEQSVLSIPKGVYFWLLDTDPPPTTDRHRTLPSRTQPYLFTTETRPLVDQQDPRGRLLVPAWMLLAALLATSILMPQNSTQWWFVALSSLAMLGPLVYSIYLSSTIPTVSEEGINKFGSVTLVASHAPLWIHGTRKALPWLFPGKKSQETNLLIVTMLDPETDSEDAPRLPIIPAAAYLLAEELELTTDLRCRVAAPTVVGTARRFLRKFSKQGFGPFALWSKNYPAGTLVIWGNAMVSPDRVGFELFACRNTEQEKIHTIKGTLEELRTKLPAWLKELNVIEQSNQRPPGLSRALPPEKTETWFELLNAQELIVLSKPEDKILPPPSEAFARQSLEKALAFAKQYGDSFPQAWMLAFSMGIECTKHGLVSEELKQDLREAILRFPSINSHFGRLLPVFLLGIGELELGVQHAKKLLPQTGGPLRSASDGYTQWLEELIRNPQLPSTNTAPSKS